MPVIDVPFSGRAPRILIIKPSALGDVVHTLPVLNLLRRRWPGAHISWLVGSAFAGLLHGHPQLDEIISFDRRQFGKSWYSPRAAWEFVRFLTRLHERTFDLVIDLQGLFRSAWLGWLTQAPFRVGFSNARELAPVFYTHSIDVGSSEQHAIDRYLTLTKSLGCGRGPVQFNFVSDDRDQEHARALTRDVGPYAVLMPGTNWLTKRWSAERFGQLIKPLRERFGLASVIAGGSDAAELAPQIPADVNAVGKTNLRQLVALLRGASLVIANDSGPMHIAAALERPLVTMFGPTNPVRTGPYGRPDSVVCVGADCSPCYSRKCLHPDHMRCMNRLEVEMVLAAAQQQIAKYGQ